MAPRFLLDTNVLSELIRHPQGPIARKIASIGENALCTSVVIAPGLRSGASKSGSARLVDRVALILSALEPLEPLADQHYAATRHHLAERGMPIGPNDLLIAPHALAADLTVVTANARELARVPGLRVENWAN